MNILLTVEELAKYLKIKPDTIYKKVRRGELPAIKLGKLVRFPKDLIDQWITEQATKTMKEVRKAAKVARKVAHKVMGDVPEFIEEVKKAPFNKKQAVLKRGLKTIWKDINTGVVQTGVRTRTRKVSTAARKAKTMSSRKAKAKTANGKAGPAKVTEGQTQDTTTT